MSDSPVVELTALDAKALRELVEGLLAEVKALRREVDAIKAEPRTIVIQEPIRPYPLQAVAGEISLQERWPSLFSGSATTSSRTPWWGDPNDAPVGPPQ